MATTKTPTLASTDVTSATKRTSPAPGDSYVQSFARGLEVIRSFSSQSTRQPRSEVAASTGVTHHGARVLMRRRANGR